ncbi:MAG: site-specific DNA-methyltransferase [Aestuariivirga sp.]|uniref:site-specific DNA-methyltransferase n=1 Tax=Aestuariivirga sp. TaxID=2650926 RepID=UPI0025C43D26|nr:site-specific DNA-methyltransferase [Aestuariivirga sp.]MCA3561866.1 site-specific DNA-methyltransferase [Aestuariivirga sp.]
MAKNQKLELTWVGKENRPRLEPRILLEDPEKSYHAKHRVSDDDIFDNRLIFGDNLLALKALEQEFAGKVKCVFIDPPYNTGSAFEHYDDGLEHSIWLGLMRDRLEIIRRLLSEEGSLWITIDDNEAHYLKVLCDEIFGRKNFVANVVWQKRYARDNNAAIGSAHDHVFVYEKTFDAFRKTRNRVELDYKTRAPYKNPNNDPKGPWQSISFTGAGFRANMMYPIIGPDGREHRPPEGRHWAALEPEYHRLRKEGRIWFGSDGKGVPRVIRYLSEVEGLVPSTWWPHEEVGHNDEAKKDAYNLHGKENAFDTPKPERLLGRIIHIATDPGDLVLDSFAGSGTTGAVAHKMGRRWIMVELGEHCHTHIIPRLTKVIDGEDKGGVTEVTGWQGGGGFRYFKLAPSLLEKDKWGREVISKSYNAEMLAEALCKIEGFTYAPSDSVYWQHGTSTERDFIYVTTQTLSPEQLDALSEEVGEGRTLLVLCAAFRGNPSAWPNLTVKKIPNHIRERCEWGHDDYSLNVENLPKAPPATKAIDKATPRSASQPGLFDLAGDDQ